MKVQLLIEMDERSQVSVSGPINNKMLCYGLLAIAHEVVKEFNDKQSALVFAPNGATPDTSRDRHISLDAPLGRT